MSILALLSGQLQGDTVPKISEKLGIGESEASVLVSAAAPLIIKALSKNTQDEKGAESLFNAIEKDHDGSILDDVAGSFLSQDTGAGTGILKHILGGQQGIVEAGLSQLTGLSNSKTGTVLSMLAPVIMGALSKKKQEDGLDASSLADMLHSDEEEADKKEPEAMGLLSKLLDSDGDGSIADDAVDLGAKLLKGFLG